MRQIAGNNTVAAQPDRAAEGLPGYFKSAIPGEFAGTQVTQEFLNDVMLELCNIVEGFGVTLATDQDQIYQVVKRIKTLRETTGSTTGNTLAICSSTAVLDGTRAVAVATEDSIAKGTNCAAIACDTGSTGEGSSKSVVCASVIGAAYGTLGAVIACDGASLQADTIGCALLACVSTDAYGTRNGGLACDGAVIRGLGTGALSAKDTVFNANAEFSASIASQDGDVDGGLCGLFATYDCATSGATSAVIASTSSQVKNAINALVAGSAASEASATNASVISGNGSAASNTSAAVVASRHTENATPYSIAGGRATSAITPSGSNQNNTWRIESEDPSGGSNHGLGRFLSGTVTSGLDYAEIFPNETQGEIPKCVFVCHSVANPGTVSLPGRDTFGAFGIVSVRPSVLGDPSAFGAHLLPANELGEIAPDAQMPLSLGLEYSQQPEQYTKVALVGQVRLRVDASVCAGMTICWADENGHGTNNRAVAQVMRRVFVMRMLSPYDEARGYGIAQVLLT